LYIEVSWRPAGRKETAMYLKNERTALSLFLAFVRAAPT